MHACGHDANTTMKIGLVEAVRDSEFNGTLKVFFQPTSEIEGGGKPISEIAHLEDVEYMIMLNMGMGIRPANSSAESTTCTRSSGYEANCSGPAKTRHAL